MKFVTSEADAEALGKQARHAIRDLGVLSESEPLVALAELKMTLAATHTQTGKAVQRARSLGVPEADVREALGSGAEKLTRRSSGWTEGRRLAIRHGTTTTTSCAAAQATVRVP